MTRASFIRSFLKRGTAVLTSTFLLLAMMGSGGGENTDTFTEAPRKVYAAMVKPVAITDLTTTSTTTTATLTISTTTTTATTSSTSTKATSTSTTTTTSKKATTTTISTNLSTTSTATTTAAVVNSLPINEQDRILIANVVSHEAGCSWISEYERTCIVAAIMNRVKDPRFPNTVDAVLHQPYQFFNVPYYRVDYSGIGYAPIDAAIDAYFSGKYNCGNINSWSGNGHNNNFYYQ